MIYIKSVLQEITGTISINKIYLKMHMLIGSTIPFAIHYVMHTKQKHRIFIGCAFATFLIFFIRFGKHQSFCTTQIRNHQILGNN